MASALRPLAQPLMRVGVELKVGEGAKIAGESELEFRGAKQAELLLFDLP